MKRYLFIQLALSLFLLVSCGKGKGDNKQAFPDNFNAMGDTARVAYVMANASPDSVARFICLASLGKVEGARIDTLAIATVYAYEKYTGEDFDRFSDAFEHVKDSLPLSDKMRLLSLAGAEDPQKLGLELGLEYMQQIRDNNLTVAQVEEELKAFKAACGDDKETYRRFLVGFKAVLKADMGVDVPKDIYEKFINYPEY